LALGPNSELLKDSAPAVQETSAAGQQISQHPKLPVSMMVASSPADRACKAKADCKELQHIFNLLTWCSALA
jgi:hypothetical protein